MNAGEMKINKIVFPGFPDAEKFISISDPKLKRLSDLALHMEDLCFSSSCLKECQAQSSDFLKQALWRCAIIHFVKCYGDHESRFSILPDKVFKDIPNATSAFSFFKSIRNCHFIHDVNSFSMSVPGAILNKQGITPKIAKVMCITKMAESLCPENISNLKSLIATTQKWVENQFNEISQIVQVDLEKLDYANLSSMPEMNFSSPKVNEINENALSRV